MFCSPPQMEPPMVGGTYHTHTPVVVFSCFCCFIAMDLAIHTALQRLLLLHRAEGFRLLLMASVGSWPAPGLSEPYVISRCSLNSLP